MPIALQKAVVQNIDDKSINLDSVARMLLKREKLGFAFYSYYGLEPITQKILITKIALASFVSSKR